ncbi:MAG: cytochrome c biogenesis protein CcdA [Proteobacteria bacterium]|jgi:cytochrome c-type biogenesis protein|nr:cytochrome c biogenesis protein CcdA [Pseudomonadota bacterium]
MYTLVESVSAWLHTNPWLALIGVFLGGALTSANPCVLATIPLVMGFVMGRREETGPLKALGYSLVFVFGLAITFVILGVTAALAGSLYGEVPSFFSWIVAAVCLVMGIHMVGIIELPIPNLVRKQPKATGVAGALLLGLLFGFVSAPCAAPLLIVLLTYLAGSGASVAWGAMLLLVYALGHSVLVLIAGTSMGAAQALLNSDRLKRVTEVLHRVAGVLVILVGAWFLMSSLL